MATSKVIKEANVTISIKGLALSRYNKGNQNWETRFLRHVPGHDLRVVVKKDGTVIFSEAVDKHEKISIVTNKAKEVPSHHTSGDDYDIRHLVDFNSDDLCGTSFKFNNSVMTFLSTSDACFYSKTISGKLYTVKKNGKEVFTRKIGIITGGDIVSLDKTEIFFVNSPDKNQVLPAETGVIYEIVFDNDCPDSPKDGSSDFDKFSEVIESADKYTLTEPDVLAYMDPGEGDERDEGTSKDPPCGSALGG